MPNMWSINNGTLYTNNGGYDKLKNPMIPFSEFLEDCFGVDTFVEFINYMRDIIDKEIQHFPKHMKDLAMNDIKNAKRAFLEDKKKNALPECVISYVAKKNSITPDDAKYIYQESRKLMPILQIQYKNDLDMICLKMKEFQKILRQKLIKKNNDNLTTIISK